MKVTKIEIHVALASKWVNYEGDALQEKYWKQTKYKIKNGKLIPTDDSRYLNRSSYLIAAITADYYSVYIPKYVKGVTADLGCGYAPMYQYYRKYAEKVICVDWENSAHKNKMLDIRCNLSETLPLEDESVDTVILSDVLEHIYKPEFLLREIHRILRPQGALLLNVPFIYPEHEKPYDYFRYTEFYYRNIARELGYNIPILKRIGGEKEVIRVLLGKYIENYLGLGSIKPIEWLNKWAYKKWKCTKGSNEINMCLGYFAVLTKRVNG